jgi:hypothetical protein
VCSPKTAVHGQGVAIDPSNRDEGKKPCKLQPIPNPSITGRVIISQKITATFAISMTSVSSSSTRSDLLLDVRTTTCPLATKHAQMWSDRFEIVNTVTGHRLLLSICSFRPIGRLLDDANASSAVCSISFSDFASVRPQMT